MASSYFPTQEYAVSWAMKSLTTEFGMGSGIPSSLWTPRKCPKCIIDREGEVVRKQASRAISIGQLNASRRLHLRPIDQVVYLGPSGLASGSTYLKAGFPLRCFQRLSLPHIATLLCRWRDNRITRGASIPVLSYYGQALSILLRPQKIGTKLSHDVLNPARVPL